MALVDTFRFSDAEYENRLARTRAAMEKAGIDTLVTSDPSNMAWLTGYDGWSFYVHQAVIIGPVGEPLWWGRAMDRAGALRTVWMSPAWCSPNFARRRRMWTSTVRAPP